MIAHLKPMRGKEEIADWRSGVNRIFRVFKVCSVGHFSVTANYPFLRLS